MSMKTTFPVFASMFLVVMSSNSFAENELNLQSLGIQKQTIDTNNTRTDTYTRETGRIGDHGYGVYGRSTREFKRSTGERDTNANEVRGRGTVSGGVYVDF